MKNIFFKYANCSKYSLKNDKHIDIKFEQPFKSISTKYNDYMGNTITACIFKSNYNLIRYYIVIQVIISILNLINESRYYARRWSKKWLAPSFRRRCIRKRFNDAHQRSLLRFSARGAFNRSGYAQVIKKKFAFCDNTKRRQVLDIDRKESRVQWLTGGSFANKSHSVILPIFRRLVFTINTPRKYWEHSSWVSWYLTNFHVCKEFLLPESFVYC